MENEIKFQRNFSILLCAVMIAVTICLSFASQIKVIWQTLWPVLAVVSFFMLLRIRYKKQGEVNLVAVLEGSAILLTFTSFFAVGTYLAPEHASSMYDTEFSVIDALTFEAPPIIEFTRSFPSFDEFLVFVYNTLYLHLALLVIYAAGVRKDNLRSFVNLNRLFIAALVGLLLFGLFPAYNATYFYQLDDVHNTLPIVEHLKRIRADQFPELRYENILGLIQFPSFHVSTQIIFLIDILENEGKFLKLIFIPWTFFMCWSAITVGGHYVVDLAGGVFIAAFSYVVLKTLKRYLKSKEAT